MFVEQEGRTLSDLTEKLRSRFSDLKNNKYKVQRFTATGSEANSMAGIDLCCDKKGATLMCAVGSCVAGCDQAFQECSTLSLGTKSKIA